MKSIIITIILSFSSLCCSQEEWLNVKRSKEDVRPETLRDFQAMLDDYPRINNVFKNIGLVGTDNTFIPVENFNSVSQTVRNAYLWRTEIWEAGSGSDWHDLYKIVMIANNALDGLKNLNGNTNEARVIRGHALFLRAMAFYTLYQTFGQVYDRNTSTTNLGIPLRLSSDSNILYQRASVSQTIDQIMQDAEEASKLLPEKQLTNYRPNQNAALGLLAKVYLCVGDYTNARLVAEGIIQKQSSMLNFNSAEVSLAKTYRFPEYGRGNSEIFFYARAGYPATTPSLNASGLIPKELYNQYEEDDLRKKYFFLEETKDRIRFRGSYAGDAFNFCGIALNEIVLISSESNARLGNIGEALDRLNMLLTARYVQGKFKEIAITEKDSLLSKILLERRKELPLTGCIRWEDLRRLNKEEKFALTLRRIGSSENTILLPDSPNYALPIPIEEVEVSNVKQNPRN